MRTSLAECSKNQNKGRDLVESVKQLQRAGLQVQGGFIVGFDNDPPSIFQQQIDFIQKSGIVTAMVGLLQAPLGTRLYERMQKEGRLVNEFSGDNVNGSTNIIPRMGLEPLREGYRQILSHIYAPKILLRADFDISSRVPAAQDQGPPGAAIYPGPVAVNLPTGHPRRRTRPILAALFLDSVPASTPVLTGNHSGHPGLPFSPGGRAAC